MSLLLVALVRRSSFSGDGIDDMCRRWHRTRWESVRVSRTGWCSGWCSHVSLGVERLVEGSRRERLVRSWSSGRSRDVGAVGVSLRCNVRQECKSVRTSSTVWVRVSAPPVMVAGRGGGGPAGNSMPSESSELSESSSAASPGGGPSGITISSSSSSPSSSSLSSDSAKSVQRSCQLPAHPGTVQQGQRTLLCSTNRHRHELSHFFRCRSCTRPIVSSSASRRCSQPAPNSRFSRYGIPGGGAPKGLKTGS